MVSIEQAMQLVDEYTSTGTKTITTLQLARNQYLADSVSSPIHMPPFHQSAMDGYAVHFNQDHQNNFVLIDEIKAGDAKNPSLEPGEAVRIFTGAPVPNNTNAVIMQENCNVQNNILIIEDQLTPNKNIRKQGEQIQKGATALEKGALLNPAAIGFLATLGITEVAVYKMPKICIVVTGNELVSPGTPLKHGQIYESNAIMLQTALAEKGFTDVAILKVKDDYTATKDSLKNALENCNFLLISGGISVGDYDFVGKALLELNTEQVFYKIKQKPGKPMFFGINQQTLIFALPGNPASALTCFYIYIDAALQKHIGNPNHQKQTVTANLKNDYDKKGIRGEFLKATLHQNQVEILPNQSSAMLNSYAKANALIYLEEGVQIYNKGTKVTVFPIA